MKPIISVRNLGKQYRISRKTDDAPTNFREVLADLPRRLLRGGVKTKAEYIWALKDISFDIMPGERVGIIGRNGAGKSTLLKLLSRITEPSTGTITLHGRTASLLEVGTGFHAELTGRENIYLNGAVLGMSRAEITKKFDEIVDFAGVEEFLDVPVKRYSSGMYVRLGFAVAAHLEPEILVVDEVLAVGDMAFQKKCLGKMEEVSTGQGRTVLFVSHQMGMVASLCERALLLQSGQIVSSGRTSDVINNYYGMNDGGSFSVFTPSEGQTIGDDIAQLVEASIEDAEGRAAGELLITNPCSIRMTFNVSRQVDRKLVAAIHFYMADGSLAFSVLHPATKFEPGQHSLICHIPANFLNDTTYSISLVLASFEPFSLSHFIQEGALVCTTVDPMEDTPTRCGYPRPMSGAVRPLLQWSYEKKLE